MPASDRDLPRMCRRTSSEITRPDNGPSTLRNSHAMHPNTVKAINSCTVAVSTVARPKAPRLTINMVRRPTLSAALSRNTDPNTANRMTAIEYPKLASGCPETGSHDERPPRQGVVVVLKNTRPNDNGRTSDSSVRVNPASIPRVSSPSGSRSPT